MDHCNYQGVTAIIFEKKNVFLRLEISFALANSVDPDEMPQNVALHLGLHCLPKYSLRSHQYMKG